MPDIHLTYWLRRLRGLLLYVLGRTPHPVLLRHSKVRLDPAAIQRSAAAGEPFALPLRGRQVDIQVRPSNLHGDDSEIIIEGVETQRQPVPRTVTFVGSVLDEDDSDVRLTITPRTITGYVRIGEEGNWIDPLRRFRPHAHPTEFVVYRSKDTVFKASVKNDIRLGDSQPADGDHRVNPHVPIAVGSDAYFQGQAAIVGLDWWEAQASVVNNLNGFYPSKVGIEFTIRVHMLHSSTNLQSNDPDTLLDQFGARVRQNVGDIRQLSVRQDRGVELAHLMTGRNLNGKTIGIAWQPGVWGLSEVHYFGYFGASPLNTLTVGHEIGHNFRGDHDLAEKICVTHFFVCLDYERTIMWPTIYDDNRKEFSAANDSRVTNNAQSGRNVNYTHP